MSDRLERLQSLRDAVDEEIKQEQSRQFTSWIFFAIYAGALIALIVLKIWPGHGEAAGE